MIIFVNPNQDERKLVLNSQRLKKREIENEK